MGEADFEFVADIDAFDTLHETAFHGWIDDPDVGSFIGDAGGDGEECLAHFAAHGDSDDALLHGAFDFTGGVFPFGAVSSDGR